MDSNDYKKNVGSYQEQYLNRNNKKKRKCKSEISHTVTFSSSMLHGKNDNHINIESALNN